MLFDNLKRVFKKPDKEQETERKKEIDSMGLEKNDVPAMILSAYLVFIPAAIIILGVIALVAFLFVK